MPHGPNWDKSPAELAERFTATVSAMPGAEVGKMFGYPAGFVNGQLFTGLFASSWHVRLPDAERAELAAAGGAPFEPMPGRPMREDLILPDEIAGDPTAAQPWLDHALAYVRQLPPKKKR